MYLSGRTGSYKEEPHASDYYFHVYVMTCSRKSIRYRLDAKIHGMLRKNTQLSSVLISSSYAYPFTQKSLILSALSILFSTM